ncbi:MAG: hypothetical protein JSW54_09120, partial [Fidelibacterota bacterium]
MKHKFSVRYLILSAICILAGYVCDFNPVSADQGEWVSDIPFTFIIGPSTYTLPHDNRIYESDNVLVFSDASSDEVKKQLSTKVERALRELKEAFDISSSAELGITEQDSKIKVYANRNRLDIDQRFFPIGFVIFSLDSPYFETIEKVYKENYDRLVK